MSSIYINIVFVTDEIAVNQMKKISQEFGSPTKQTEWRRCMCTAREKKNDRKSKSFQEFVGFVYDDDGLVYFSPFLAISHQLNSGCFNILIISFSLCQTIIETMMNEYLLCINFLFGRSHIDAETNEEQKYNSNNNNNNHFTKFEP